MGYNRDMTTQPHTTQVGVGVMLLKDGKVLLTRRKGSHGAGEYSFPGGKLDYMESFEDCARRETREECGCEIKNIEFLFLTNLTKYAPKHFVHIGMVAEWASGEPTVMEPDKAEEWKWYDLDNLPEGPMFETCKTTFESYKTKQKYYPTHA